MSAKYQIKTPQGISYFRKKSDFIENCQLYFNSNRSGVIERDIHFSYDNGITWIHIENFKRERQIIQNEKNTQESSHKNQTTENKGIGKSWPDYVAYVFIIWIGLTALNKEFTKIGFINELNGSLFGWDSHLVRPRNLKEKMNAIQPERNTQTDENSNSNGNFYTLTEENISRLSDENTFTHEAIDDYNKSDIFKEFQLSEDEKYWVLTIKSDPNPDPYGNEGQYCSTVIKCKWCSNEVPGVKVSIKKQLDNWEKSIDRCVAVGFLKTLREKETSIALQYTDEDILKQRNSLFEECNQMINQYKNGERYLCVIEGLQYGSTGQYFCSEKCKREWEYSR